MLPSKYCCSSCNESFFFPFADAYYYLGKAAAGQLIASKDLLAVPMRPAWCKDCASLCPVEDIATVRDFENAYGALRSGKQIEYPFSSENLDTDVALSNMAVYLQWRMTRRHAPRALCCGGNRFQYMDVELPLFKHAECDFGYLKPWYLLPGPYNGPGPGIRSAANFRFYTPEGELAGQLTWYERQEEKWQSKRLAYPEKQEN